MGSTQQASEPEASVGTESSLLQTILNSVLLRIAAVGVALIALGAVLRVGVWAAIVAVWGGGLVIVGLGLYGFIWWRRN